MLGLDLTLATKAAKKGGPAYGPELNGDPSFDSAAYWTAIGTGWAVASGMATGTAVTGSVSKTLGSISAGQTYRLSFTVTGRSTGSVRAFVGTTPAYTAAQSANGSYSFNVVATAGGSFGINSADGFTGNVTDLSVKRVT